MDFAEELRRAISSPDGRFRLEETYYQPERQAAEDVLRLIDTMENSILLSLLKTNWVGEPQFGPPGSMQMIVSYRGQQFPLLLDLAERTYQLHPHDYPVPLPHLATELSRLYPGPRPKLRPAETHSLLSNIGIYLLFFGVLTGLLSIAAAKLNLGGSWRLPLPGTAPQGVSLFHLTMLLSSLGFTGAGLAGLLGERRFTRDWWSHLGMSLLFAAGAIIYFSKML
jgi:hypothetical protein